MVTRADGGDSSSIPLPGRFDWLLDVEWSPSGKRLAYTTLTEPSRYALMVLGPDGSRAVPVVKDSVAIASPRWSPHEEVVYYLRGKAELRRVGVSSSSGAPEGKPVTLVDGLQVARGPDAVTPSSFTMTADGSRMVYLKSFDQSNLWLLSPRLSDAAGSVWTRQLTRGTALRRGPAVSPDGKWLAYIEESSDGADLYRMPLEGGTAERLTFTGLVASEEPAWSPDGRHIAFGGKEDASVQLQTVATGGGLPHLFPNSRLPTMGEVTWAPAPRILHQIPGNRNFALVDPATGQTRLLIGNETAGWLFSPRVSPRGDQVAIYWNRARQRGLWLISLRDSSRTLLKEGRLSPVGWTGDGKAVLAVDWNSGDLLRLGVDGLAEDRMTFPFREAECSSADSFRRGLIVCAVRELVADVWMVTGFDPDKAIAAGVGYSGQASTPGLLMPAARAAVQLLDIPAEIGIHAGVGSPRSLPASRRGGSSWPHSGGRSAGNVCWRTSAPRSLKGNILASVPERTGHPNQLSQEFVGAAHQCRVEQAAVLVEDLPHAPDVHVPEDRHQPQLAKHRQRGLDDPGSAEGAGRHRHDPCGLVDVFLEAAVQDVLEQARHRVIVLRALPAQARRPGSCWSENAGSAVPSPLSSRQSGSLAMSINSVSTTSRFCSWPWTNRAAWALIRPFRPVPRITGMLSGRASIYRLLRRYVGAMRPGGGRFPCVRSWIAPFGPLSQPWWNLRLPACVSPLVLVPCPKHPIRGGCRSPCVS